MSDFLCGFIFLQTKYMITLKGHEKINKFALNVQHVLHERLADQTLALSTESRMTDSFITFLLQLCYYCFIFFKDKIICYSIFTCFNKCHLFLLLK